MKSLISAYLLLATIFFAFMFSPARSEARKIKTKLPTKNTTTQSNEDKLSNQDTKSHNDFTIEKKDSDDDFEGIKDKIRFYGFDKTLTSAKESFFVTNGLDNKLSGITIEITYFDMQHRQLHQTNQKLSCEIPPGETRRLDIKSWDTQKAFYFHQSAQPRRQATPFDVTIKLKEAEFISTEDPIID